MLNNWCIHNCVNLFNIEPLKPYISQWRDSIFIIYIVYNKNLRVCVYFEILEI